MPVDKMLAIYCSIVRPVVEYACQVWHGGLTKEQTDTIENIQERALHIIMPDASYELAMQVANLTTLSSHRVELCKMLFVNISRLSLLANNTGITHNTFSNTAI